MTPYSFPPTALDPAPTAPEGQPMTDPITEQPTINVPLLRKTIEWAESEHLKAERGEDSEWDQGYWLARTGCGTACCIAGRVAIEAGWKPLWDGEGQAATVERDGRVRAVDVVAAELLGLDHPGDRLFCAANTIDDLWQIAEELTNGEITRPVGGSETGDNR